jgi:membrane-associated PAP2 superfamily phosphatase
MPSLHIAADPYSPTSARFQYENKTSFAAPPWLLWLLLPLALVPLLIWLEMNIDVPTSAHFFDLQSASFPWRRHWLTEAIHRFGRLPAVLTFLGFAMASVLQLRRRCWIQLAQTRFVWLTMLVCVIVVNLIKRTSHSACSWDLLEFGGRYPHLNWFDSLPSTLAPGHCWPGAFALSGFVLFAVYFYDYDRARYRRAALTLAAVLLYANALGFVQVMRGAHGLSHQMWTGIICWYLTVACYGLYSCAAQKR